MKLGHEGTCILIDRLTRAVRDETSRLDPVTTLPAGSADRARLSRKLDAWQAQARGIESALRSEAGLIDIQTRGALHDRRAYAARQSRDARLGNVGALQHRLAGFVAALAMLDDRLHGPRYGRHAILEALSSGLQEMTPSQQEALAKTVHELSHVVQQGDTAATILQGGPAPAQTHALPKASPIGLVLLAMGLIALLRLRLNGRD